MPDRKNGEKDILERLKSGEAIPMNHPDYGQVRQAVNETMKLLNRLNNSTNTDEIRKYLSEITEKRIDETTTIFPPFYTNFGRFISLGKNVFINHACSFLDLGGIVIEDDVMIAPRVNIISENHPVEVSERKTLVPAKVVIKRNAWIGAAATIMPGITIGENSVVAAGAMVTKDVAPNTLVAGVPAKQLKEL